MIWAIDTADTCLMSHVHVQLLVYEALTSPPKSMHHRQALNAHSGLLCRCNQCCFARSHTEESALGSNCCWVWYG
jgi:hypothetical protein